MPDQDNPVLFLQSPLAKLDLRHRTIRERDPRVAAAKIEFPTVERALNTIADHLAKTKMSTQMRAMGVHETCFATLAPVQHDIPTEDLQTRHRLRRKLRRPAHLKPARGIRPKWETLQGVLLNYSYRLRACVRCTL